MVKNLPAMQEMQVRSLGQENPLEKEMAMQSSILAWRIPWTEEPGRLQIRGVAKRHNCVTNNNCTWWRFPLKASGLEKLFFSLQ